MAAESGITTETGTAGGNRTKAGSGTAAGTPSGGRAGMPRDLAADVAADVAADIATDSTRTRSREPDRPVRASNRDDAIHLAVLAAVMRQQGFDGRAIELAAHHAQQVLDALHMDGVFVSLPRALRPARPRPRAQLELFPTVSVRTPERMDGRDDIPLPFL